MIIEIIHDLNYLKQLKYHSTSMKYKQLDLQHCKTRRKIQKVTKCSHLDAPKAIGNVWQLKQPTSR